MGKQPSRPGQDTSERAQHFTINKGAKLALVQFLYLEEKKEGSKKVYEQRSVSRKLKSRTRKVGFSGDLFLELAAE